MDGEGSSGTAATATAAGGGSCEAAGEDYIGGESEEGIRSPSSGIEFRSGSHGTLGSTPQQQPKPQPQPQPQQQQQPEPLLAAIEHLKFPHDYYDASVELEAACRRGDGVSGGFSGAGVGRVGGDGLPAAVPAPRRHIVLELEESSSDDEDNYGHF